MPEERAPPETLKLARGKRTARPVVAAVRHPQTLLMILLLGVFAAIDARAAFELKDTTWQGTSELLGIARERLGAARVHVVAALPWDEIRSIDALLILHPEQEMDYREVAAFLGAGGRLALLDDYGKGDSLLARFRIHRVRAPLEPRESLRDNPNLPIAIPRESGDGSRPHPIVEGVGKVVTNHPTGLETDKELQLTTVLDLPSRDGPPTPFALIGVIGDAKRCGLVGESDDLTLASAANTSATGKCGRLFAMGDPSALMNLMLRYPGNRVLAGRLVEYLVGDDAWGHRGGTLYIAANQFTEQGSFGKGNGNGNGNGNEFASAVEDRLDALSRLVAETRRDGLPDSLALLIAALLAAGVSLWAATATMRRYRRALPRYARPTPLVAQGGLAGRAAVLSAAGTHPALAVLELKSALEEATRDRLGLPSTASVKEIIAEIDRQKGLSRRSSDSLGELFREMAKAEAAVTRTEPIRIRDHAILRMHERMTAILAELDGHLGGRR